MTRAPLTGFSLWLLVFALGIAAFIDGLDYSIANVAIPAIAASFGVTPQQGTWIITLLSVSNIIVIVLTGWLVTRFGSVKVALWSIILYGISSFLCGIAWSFDSLVFFRIVQGAVGGPLMSVPQTIILLNCPEDKKGVAISFLLMLMVLAPILGPFIGGWITENYGWPWIFYINVPLAILSAFLVWKILHDREDKVFKAPVDVVGLIFLSVGLTSLQVFLDRGNEYDWFGSTLIIVLAVTAVVTLTLFGVWNHYAKHPLVDLSFLADRNFFVASMITALLFLVLMGTTILIPLWLQTQKNYTPYWAGVAVMPIGILPVFVAPIVGFIMYAVGLRLLVTLSFLVFAFTCFEFSEFTSEVSLWHLMKPRFIQGLGMGLCFAPVLQLALVNIKEENIAKATSMFNFLRAVGGGGLSTAIYITTWERQATRYHSSLNEVMSPLRSVSVQTYETLSSAGIDDLAAAQVFDHMVSNQAFLLSFNDIMWLSGMLILIMIPFIWLCKEPAVVRKANLAME